MTLNVKKMNSFKEMITTARLANGMMVREVANALEIDQSLISRFEKGGRKPTQEQVVKLAELYNINEKRLMIAWLTEKIVYDLQDQEYGLEALMLAEERVVYETSQNKRDFSATIKEQIAKIDALKKQLTQLRHLDSHRVAQALELEYTFESNRIEGNTLTLRETDLVVNEGLTISGKSMREHLEVINHSHAIDFVKDCANKNTVITERLVLQLHNLILRGIDEEYAGKYRNVQVMIQGSKHLPPQAFLVPKQMEEYFIWYNKNRNKLHPVVLAAEMHEKLVTIHPFIDGNGRTSRLLMNLILLQHGFVIANIKGDAKNRMDYYTALETVQTEGSQDAFIHFILENEVNALDYYINILGR